MKPAKDLHVGDIITDRSYEFYYAVVLRKKGNKGYIVNPFYYEEAEEDRWDSPEGGTLTTYTNNPVDVYSEAMADD